ncbi:MAG: hypothetical protein PHQ64_03080 [Bacilli bacterium]|nr:hypothetical protein [Bacilli bacterium]
MKYKKGLIFMALGILLIISGLITNLVISINKEKKIEEKLITEIVDKHEQFAKDVKNFSDIKNNIFESVIGNLYNEYVTTDYDNWIEELDEYKEITDKVNKYKDYINDKCTDRLYTNREANNACNSFKLNLEGTINYYINDVEKFNSFIDEYNKTTDNKKELYELTYEYTDFNNDGDYVGKSK